MALATELREAYQAGRIDTVNRLIVEHKLRSSQILDFYGVPPEQRAATLKKLVAQGVRFPAPTGQINWKNPLAEQGPT
jgi:hypothetical protein